LELKDNTCASNQLQVAIYDVANNKLTFAISNKHTTLNL